MSLSLNLVLMTRDDNGQWKYPLAVGRANSFLNARGADPGIGYILVSGSDWLPVRDALGSIDASSVAARQKVRNLSQTLSITLGTDVSNVTLAPLWVVWAKKVSGGAEIGGAADAVYLLRLTDRRWFDGATVVTQQYNVRGAAPPAMTGTGLYLPGSLDSGNLWTWRTMCKDLWNLAIDQAFPGLPYDPDGIPEGFSFLGVPALDSLEVVLDRLHCHLCYDPVSDQYGIFSNFTTSVQLATLLENEPAFMDPYGDQEGAQNSMALIPEHIKVHFRHVYKHYGTEAGTAVDANNWLTNAVHTETIATNLPGALPGSSLPLWDDLPCIIAFNGSVYNGGDLTSRANERVTNYVQRVTQCGGRQFTQYSGIQYLYPDSQIAAVHYRHIGDGISTTFWNLPGRVNLEDNEVAGLMVAPALLEHLETPDFARFTTPSWPPLLQQVVVDGTTGTVASVNGGGFIEAHVLRTDPEDNFLSASAPFHAEEVCWLVVTNIYTGNANGTPLMAGERYLARLNGTATYGGDSRPLYLLHRENNEIYHITMGATVAPGASTSVTLPDGRSVTATNQTATTLNISDLATAYEDLKTGTWFLTGGGSGSNPDNMAIVNVYGAAANGSCLWSGKIAVAGNGSSYCSNQFTNGAACWITVLNSETGSLATTSAQLVVGDSYIGRMVGTISDVPVYAIQIPDRIFHVTVPSPGCGSGATIASVVLPNGQTVTATNWSPVSLVTGDLAYAGKDLTTGLWYLWKSGGATKWNRVKALLNANLYPADSAATVDTITTMDGNVAPAITAPINLLNLAGNNDEVVILEWVSAIGSWDTDAAWFVSEVQGKVRRRVKALINNAGGLLTTDANATVDTVTTFDGSTAPTVTTAANTLKLSGEDNDIVILEEITSASPSTWFVAEIQAQPVSVTLQGTLGQTLLNSNTTNVTISGITGVTSADNPMGYAGPNGANVFVTKISGTWKITGVQQYVQTYATNTQIDAANKKLQYTTQQFVGMDGGSSTVHDVDTGTLCT